MLVEDLNLMLKLDDKILKLEYIFQYLRRLTQYYIMYNFYHKDPLLPEELHNNFVKLLHIYLYLELPFQLDNMKTLAFPVYLQVKLLTKYLQLQ